MYINVLSFWLHVKSNCVWSIMICTVSEHFTIPATFVFYDFIQFTATDNPIYILALRSQPFSRDNLAISLHCLEIIKLILDQQIFTKHISNKRVRNWSDAEIRGKMCHKRLPFTLNQRLKLNVYIYRKKRQWKNLL